MARRLLSGIEAVALAAIEGGANLVTSAADTPCVQIAQEAKRQQAKAQIENLNAEIALDSHAALDAASIAAVGGARAVWACSHEELYDESADLIAIRRFKMKGALVVVTCGDTKSVLTNASSDVRRFAQHAKIPIFDPSDAKQAMEIMKAALTMSAEYEIPVIVNLATNIISTSMFMEIGPLGSQRATTTSTFNDVYLKNASLDEKIHKIGHAFSYDQNLIRFNRIYDRTRQSYDGAEVPVSLGITCSGSSVPFVVKALEIITQVALKQNISLPAYRVLQVCTPYPTPKRAMFRFATGLSDILVIEGPDTIIEHAVAAESAKNYLAPKLRSISTSANIHEIRALALGIAAFFDACGPQRPANPYNHGLLASYVDEFLAASTVYQCTISLPARNPSRFDEPPFAMAFEALVEAVKAKHIQPMQLAITGIPHYMAYQKANSTLARSFNVASKQVENSSFDERVSWILSQMQKMPGMRGVILASRRDVLIDGLVTVMNLAKTQQNLTIIVVDSDDGRQVPDVDLVSMLEAFEVGVVYCDNPLDPEQSRQACEKALAQPKLSFALLVSDLPKRPKPTATSVSAPTRAAGDVTISAAATSAALSASGLELRIDSETIAQKTGLAQLYANDVAATNAAATVATAPISGTGSPAHERAFLAGQPPKRDGVGAPSSDLSGTDIPGSQANQGDSPSGVAGDPTMSVPMGSPTASASIAQAETDTQQSNAEILDTSAERAAQEAADAVAAATAALEAKRANKSPRIYLDEVEHYEEGVNGASASVPKSVKLDLSDEDGELIPINIENIVLNVSLDEIDGYDIKPVASDPYLILTDFEEDAKPRDATSKTTPSSNGGAAGQGYNVPSKTSETTPSPNGGGEGRQS